MNKIFLGLSAIVMSAMIVSCGNSSKVTEKKVEVPTVHIPPADTLINEKDSFAYGLGMNIGNNLKDQGVTELNFAVVQKGMKDVFAGGKTVITEQEANTSIQNILQGLATKKAEAAKIESAKFLDSNKLRQGVVTLPDGLQYEMLKKGDQTSVMPKAEDTIVANYIGMLTNGKEFDNSYKRGEPLTIKANEVIKGWTEIVQHMHIGDKVKVYIPSELGYGDRGAGADIPPGATLVFEMELLGVKPFVPGAAASKMQKTETVPANNKSTKAKTVKPTTTKPAVKTK